MSGDVTYDHAPSGFAKRANELGSQGNQARLNNGCVCDSGCDQCGRLADAFTEMRDILGKAPKPPFDSGYKKAMLNYALDCARWHAGLENVLARVAMVSR